MKLAMKSFSIISLLLILCCTVFGQSTQCYIAAVKTKEAGTVKGVLYNVTNNGVVLDCHDSLIVLNSTEIKEIKIFTSPTPYKYKKVFIYDPWGESNFETIPNSQVKRRKWGEKDPTLQEEIIGHVATGAINVAINLIASPIQAINTNIYKVRIAQKIEKFNEVRKELYNYSIHYQLYADSSEELKKAMAITNAASASPKKN
jgi:hypothetical protein